jgi:hypothetical protein
MNKTRSIMTDRTRGGVLLNILTVVLQLGSTFVLTFAIYMVLAIGQNFEGGFDNVVGMAIIQPLMGAIICGLTIIVCLIIGLPIRLIKLFNNWWTNHFLISVGGTGLGITFIIISFIPTLREVVKVTTDGVEHLKEIPNLILSIAGWFVTAFFTLHIYPPNRARIVLNRFAGKILP